MRRRVRKVTGPTGLDWSLKRLLFPVGMRTLSPIEMLDAATPRRTVVDGVPGRVPDAFGSWTGPLPLGFLLLPVTLPFLPIVLLLRWAGCCRGQSRRGRIRGAGAVRQSCSRTRFADTAKRSAHFNNSPRRWLAVMVRPSFQEQR